MTERGLSRKLRSTATRGLRASCATRFLRAAGYTADALDRPVVGIAYTTSDFNPCHASAPALIDAIRRGVTMAGGVPFTFPTISLHESFAWPSSMLLRNGDRIRLDVAGRRLDLLVDDAELARRRAALPPHALPARGYARLYARHVTQAPAGCDFDFLTGAGT